MSTVKIKKVLTVPSPLEANTVYIKRNTLNTGVELFFTDSAATVALPMSVDSAVGGAASSILNSDLTASKVLVSSATGKIEVDTEITLDELHALKGLTTTSTLATQLGTFLTASTAAANTDIAAITGLTATKLQAAIAEMVGVLNSAVITSGIEW